MKKICIKCGLEKDTSLFYSWKKKSNGTKTKLNTCKECYLEAKRKRAEKIRRKNNIPKAKRRNVKKDNRGNIVFLECSLCKKMLGIHWFSADSRSVTGYSHYCDDCNVKKRKKYLTKEKMKEYREKYRDNEKRRREEKERYKNDEEYRENKKKNRRKYYFQNKETVQMKKKIKTIVKNKIIATPKKECKRLWNGNGIWARNYDRCEECLTNIYQHEGKGLCVVCYQKLNRKEPTEKDKEYRKKWYQENRERMLEKAKKRRELEDRLFKKALAGEINIDDETQNVINNYHELKH